LLFEGVDALREASVFPFDEDLTAGLSLAGVVDLRAALLFWPDPGLVVDLLTAGLAERRVASVLVPEAVPSLTGCETDLLPWLLAVVLAVVLESRPAYSLV